VKEILAAVDFSDHSEAVVAQAGAFARAFGANVTLLHVAAPDPDFVGYAAGPDTVRDARARQLREEHRRLQGFAEGLRRGGVSAGALLIEGATATKILEEATRRAADAIVMGSRGRGALRRALLGSTSEAVLRGAEAPVVLVKPVPPA
jgi:nucleotide-binding universal stress UspA family protein